MKRIHLPTILLLIIIVILAIGAYHWFTNMRANG